jgi:Flp pilus assembly pilin Flp
MDDGFLQKIRNMLRRKTKGATAIEYVLIATLLSVALITGYKRIGNSYTTIYNNIASAI